MRRSEQHDEFLPYFHPHSISLLSCVSRPIVSFFCPRSLSLNYRRSYSAFGCSSHSTAVNIERKPFRPQPAAYIYFAWMTNIFDLQVNIRKTENIYNWALYKYSFRFFAVHIYKMKLCPTETSQPHHILHIHIPSPFPLRCISSFSLFWLWNTFRKYAKVVVFICLAFFSLDRAHTHTLIPTCIAICAVLIAAALTATSASHNKQANYYFSILLLFSSECPEYHLMRVFCTLYSELMWAGFFLYFYHSPSRFLSGLYCYCRPASYILHEIHHNWWLQIMV